ncbi:hypothetical protein A6R68_05598, partial [Neotoma lepida]
DILLWTMDIVIQIICKATVIVEFMIGNTANGFIALVNIIDWVKRRKISSVDQILTALAISRINMLWSVFIISLIFSLYPDSEMTVKMVRIKNTTWILANNFSIWLATILSIFYFLKIANFSNSIFLYLKWRLKKVISVTLLLCLVFLFVNILVVNVHIGVWTDESKRNLSYSSTSNNHTQFLRFTFLINTMFTLIPFTVSLIIFTLLIFSLLTHLKNMWYNVKGSRDPSTIAHINALQTVVTFLFFYTFFFLSLATQVWVSQFMEKYDLFFAAIIITFPSVHSCVLILRNAKLREASLLVLWWLRCRSKDKHLKKMQDFVQGCRNAIFSNTESQHHTHIHILYCVPDRLLSANFIPMETSEEDTMGAAVQVMSAIILNVEFITGNFGNGFIALGNIMDWVKRRKISTVNQVLTALAISRIIVLWSLYIMVSVFSMYPDLDVVMQAIQCTNLIWVISNHFSIWLATILSILYFLKIANFSNSIFLYLWSRFQKVVSVALLVSLFLLFVDILVTNILIDMWIDEFKANVSYSYKLKNFAHTSRLLVLTNTTFTLIPFIVSMTMFILPIFSLWKHLKKIKNIAKSSRDISTTAHIKALRTVVVFLLLYVIFTFSLSAQLWSYEFEEKNFFKYFCPVGIIAFPSLHSCVLIGK